MTESEQIAALKARIAELEANSFEAIYEARDDLYKLAFQVCEDALAMLRSGNTEGATRLKLRLEDAQGALGTWMDDTYTPRLTLDADWVAPAVGEFPDGLRVRIHADGALEILSDGPAQGVRFTPRPIDGVITSDYLRAEAARSLLKEAP